MELVDDFSFQPKKNLFYSLETEKFSDKKTFANTSDTNYFRVPVDSKKGKIKFYDDSVKTNSKPYKNEIEILHIKDNAIRTLVNDDIMVGYSSLTENYFKELLNKDVSIFKDVLNLVYYEVFDNDENLQKFIEVMSNLDYELIYPTNTILALGAINHINIGVQEAAIAAFEKWDDKKNTKFLKNIHYTPEWIKNYAHNVIEYLESC